jgi:peroxiredoxin
MLTLVPKVKMKRPMAQAIEINSQAPDFVLSDYTGASVRLSDYIGKLHVILVFNRGFT